MRALRAFVLKPFFMHLDITLKLLPHNRSTNSESSALSSSNCKAVANNRRYKKVYLINITLHILVYGFQRNLMLRKEAKEKTQSFLCCHVDINRKVILYLFNVNSKQQAYRYHIGSLLGLLLFPKKTLSVWQKVFGIKNSCLRKNAKQRKSKLIS